MSKMDNLRVELTAELKSAFSELCERRAMSQKAAITRIIEWLIQQDDVTQAIVLKQIPESRSRTIAIALLEELAGRRAGELVVEAIGEVRQKRRKPRAGGAA